MVAVTAISAMLASIKGAKDIAQSMVMARDTAVFQGHMIEFQSKVIDAQQAAMSAQEEQTKLLDRIKQLEQEIAALHAWDAEKQRYELRDLRPPKGVYVYALKVEAANGEPEHILCTHCFQLGKKSFLQQETRFPGRASVLVCNACGADLYVIGAREAGHPGLRTRTG